MYIDVIITGRKRSCSQGGRGLHPQGVCIKRDLDPEGVCRRGEAASKRVYLRGGGLQESLSTGGSASIGVCLQGLGWVGQTPSQIQKRRRYASYYNIKFTSSIIFI